MLSYNSTCGLHICVCALTINSPPLFNVVKYSKKYARCASVSTLSNCQLQLEMLPLIYYSTIYKVQDVKIEGFEMYCTVLDWFSFVQ